MIDRDEVMLRLMCAALTGMHANGKTPTDGCLNGLEAEALYSADAATRLFFGETSFTGEHDKVVKVA